jgi:alkaline phosphatase
MCDDIAKQLILNSPGKDVNVILGGGRNQFTTIEAQDPEYENLLGYRTDGENLIQRWIDGKNQTNSKYITKRSELFNIKADETDFLFGLFEPDHLLYLDEILAGNKDDPTLEEMVEKAIQILSKNEKGFFVFIEGKKNYILAINRFMKRLYIS